MHQLNNLDVVLLILTVVSVLIALCRGFVKEALSIISWILAAVVVFYLLPILTPVAEIYIASPIMAGVVTAFVILIVFSVIWLLSTDRLIGQIRKSKLSSLDRMIGAVFGVLRAFLLIILFNILVSSLLPEESKTGMFKESRYFTLAGEYAEPVENLIPQSMVDMIRQQGAKIGLSDEDSSEKEETQPENPEKKEATATVSEDAKSQKEMDHLFETLAQPKVETIGGSSQNDNFDGYRENEADNLDRLIENTAE